MAHVRKVKVVDLELGHVAFKGGNVFNLDGPERTHFHDVTLKRSRSRVRFRVMVG